MPFLDLPAWSVPSLTLHVPRLYSSPTTRVICKYNHGLPELAHPSSRSAGPGLTNSVGIQPSTQATETRPPSTRKFANMDLHFTPVALVRGHGLRFCGSPSILDMGYVTTRRTRHSIPFGGREIRATSDRRQLSGNANPPTPSNRGQPASTTTSRRHTRSIV